MKFRKKERRVSHTIIRSLDNPDRGLTSVFQYTDRALKSPS
jgi:hypothetical protein